MSARLTTLLTLLGLFAVSSPSSAETSESDTLAIYEIDSIVVERTRADSKTAASFTELSQKEIDAVSYGQDVPMVLATLPSTYAYSDAGNGFGYSYMKIRGFDQNRIGMMLNGVPLNDPESHQVYWVDHPDVLSGASSVQVQRGIGTTLFGASSFGGSVDVITSPTAVQPGLHLETGYGVYTDGDVDQPTRRYRAGFATGPVLDGSAALYARYSRNDSEGYRQQSGLESESFALSALHRRGTLSNKFDLLVGSEVTNFAWDGVSPSAPVSDDDRDAQPCYDVDLDDRDARRCNRYRIYPNNVDDFRQVVGSVTSEAPISSDVTLSNTLYYVTGEGFFEQYELDEAMSDYGFDPVDVDGETVEEMDVVRRRWLANAYWGVLPQLNARMGRGRATVGLGLRRYEADHFGELVWTSVDVGAEPLDEYYRYDTEKTSVEAYARLQQPIGSRTTVSAALQYQGHRYDFAQRAIDNFQGYAFEADHDFLSPRLGVRQGLGRGVSLFGTASYAQREPSQSDYIDGDDPGAMPAFEGADSRTTGLTDPIVEPEKVLNLEFGAELVRDTWRVKAALYQLDFRDELIPIDGGRVFEEGQLRRANAEKTRHQGLELEATVRPAQGLDVAANLSIARHRFVDHEISAYWLDDYAGGLLRLDDNTIPRSPELLGNLRVGYDREPYRVGAEVQHVGKQYVDGENTEELAIDPFTLVNVSGEIDVARLIGSTRTLSLGLRVNNLFDTLYETFGYSYYDDFPARQLAFYWPGATRSIFVSLRTIL